MEWSLLQKLQRLIILYILSVCHEIKDLPFLNDLGYECFNT